MAEAVKPAWTLFRTLSVIYNANWITRPQLKKQYNADTRKNIAQIKDLTSQCAKLKEENNELKRDLNLLKAVVST